MCLVERPQPVFELVYTGLVPIFPHFLYSFTCRYLQWLKCHAYPAWSLLIFEYLSVAYVSFMYMCSSNLRTIYVWFSVCAKVQIVQLALKYLDIHENKTHRRRGVRLDHYSLHSFLIVILDSQ